MKLRTKVIAFICSSIVIFVLGVWYGFSQGAKMSRAIESIAFAAISTAQIKRLDSKNDKDIANVKNLLDIYVTYGLDEYIWWQKNANESLMSLYYPEYQEAINTSINTVTEYRKKNPEKDISSIFTDQNEKEDYLSEYNQRAEVVRNLSTN